MDMEFKYIECDEEQELRAKVVEVKRADKELEDK